MRIFVYEWTCCAKNPPLSLRREGWAMLRAILEDLQRADGIETVTLLHSSLEHKLPGEFQLLGDTCNEEGPFRQLAAGSDATLLIAPETVGDLLNRARWVAESGGRTLGSSFDAIALASDKCRCGEHWRQHSVPTPAMHSLDDDVRFPVVLKPRDGAGSQNTFLVRNPRELLQRIQEIKPAEQFSKLLLQDFVPGLAASVVFLVGPGATVSLPPASQELSKDGQFHYLGGTVPLPAPLADRAIALGRKAIDAIPGLRGYVGVDLVLGDSANGSRDFAIEINPRLTTSYLGLRVLTRDNLALAMIRVALGQEVGELRWHDKVIRFTADGNTQKSEF